jgi:hypothetical protein
MLSMGKSTLSMAIFNSKLLIYQRVTLSFIADFPAAFDDTGLISGEAQSRQQIHPEMDVLFQTALSDIQRRQTLEVVSNTPG